MCCFKFIFYCLGGGGALSFFHKNIILLLRGRGVKVNVFSFPLALDMWKEEGKGVNFFT